MTKSELKAWKAAVIKTQAVWQGELNQYQDAKLACKSTIPYSQATFNRYKHASECYLCKEAGRIDWYDSCDVCIVTKYFGDKCDNLSEYRNYSKLISVSSFDSFIPIDPLIEYLAKVVDKLKQLYLCLDDEFDLDNLEEVE